MWSKKNLLVLSLIVVITIILTSTLTLYLVSKGTLTNPFTKITGTLEPDDEAIFLLNDTDNLTHTFWRIGKDGKEIKPFYTFHNDLPLDLITVSPQNKKIAASNLFNPVFLYIFDVETKEKITLQYGDPDDRNSQAIHAFIWIDDSTLVLSYTPTTTEEPSPIFTKINLLENNTHEALEVNCPAINTNFGIPKIIPGLDRNIMYYFSGNNDAELLSCNVTNGNVDTLFNMKSDSLVEWFMGKDIVTIVENEITGNGTYQKINHVAVTYDLQANEINRTNLEGEFSHYNATNNRLLFVNELNQCVKSLNLKNGLITDVICDTGNPIFLSVGDHIYYMSSASKAENNMTLYKYDFGSDTTHTLHFKLSSPIDHLIGL